MNIAITSLYLPSGSKIGVGYQVHGLANALVKRGHRVTVFSQTGKSVDSLYDAVAIAPRQHANTFGFSWDLRKVNFSGFDVLNAHGDDWFLWGVNRPRHVHTYHGSCLAEMFNIKGLKNRLRMGLLALCETQTILMADETVTVSTNTQKYIPGIRHVIPCGVDTASFMPGGQKSDAPTLLFVGTMHGRKRGAMLLDIFRKQIRPQIPNAEMWCVCDRPEQERDGDGVRFTGRVSHEELTALFQRAWVFCLPSTYEGFGVPYIEAMASGLPVVASPNVGAIEVTRGGKDGLVVEDAQLGPTIIRLLQDGSERERLAGCGLQRSKDFSWSRICEMYEAVYQGEALSQPAAATGVQS